MRATDSLVSAARRILVSLLPVAVTVFALIGITACGSAPSPGAASGSLSPTGAASVTPGGRSVPAQLQFTSKTLDGKDFAGASLLGKPAVLWFWAPWCAICQREAPTVSKLVQAHPAVTFVGVASAAQLPAMQQFVAKYSVDSFVELDDTTGAVWEKFGVKRQPAFAFVTPTGDIDVHAGPMSETDLAQRLTTIAGA